jgi:hypothetical protein
MTSKTKNKFASTTKQKICLSRNTVTTTAGGLQVGSSVRCDLNHLIKLKFAKGSFNPGKATGQTPLSALAFDAIQLQLYWRDIYGNIVFSKNAGSWSPATVVEGVGPSYQFSVIQWKSGGYLRLYYQDFAGSVAELCSDDGAQAWFNGRVLANGVQQARQRKPNQSVDLD